MLRLHDAETHGWRFLLCEMLANGMDDESTPTEGAPDELQKLFEAALAWARESNFTPAPKHSVKKYVEQYRRSLGERKLGPIIPTFVKVYCATVRDRRYCDNPLYAAPSQVAAQAVSLAPQPRAERKPAPRTNRMFLRA